MKRIAIWCVALSLMMTVPALAARVKGTAFEDDESYDLYLEMSEGDTYLIKRVNIVSLVTLNGEDFLVIRNATGLQASQEDGYIRFAAVHAVLPSNVFIVAPNVAHRYP